MNVKQQMITALKEKFELTDDAYSVYDPKYYYEMGLPKEFVDTLVEEHKTTPPSSGVYNLEMLAEICRLFELSTETIFMGRGRNGPILLSRIQEFIKTQ